MTDTRILLPALAMAALTFTVWLRMYFARIGEMKRERIHPQAVATSPQMEALLKDTRAADNFRNLFELPVLFYLALVIIALAEQVSALTLALGGIVLWVLWGVLGFGLVH